MAPPGNTPLPPLPGASGVVHGAPAQANPWAGGPVPAVNIPPSRPPGVPPAGPPGVPPSVPPGTPGNPVVKVDDRAPALVLVLAAVVVLGMVAAGAYVVLRGGRQYPGAWDDKSKPIAEWVERERELEFDHPVKVNFLSEEEYRARATEGGDDGSVESAQYYADQVAQLRALGFIEGDVDLGEANDTLSDSGTLAYYDPQLEQVFVRGKELTPAVKVTLAHELTHVLQDQHFDLERLSELPDGRGTVLRALGEGDATLVEEAYVDEKLTAKEREAYQAESASSGDEATEELEAKVPPILTTLFSAPYALGPELIAWLDAEDGWSTINEALEDPPTEEVLFDPTVYGTEGAEPAEVTVTAPEGVEVIERSGFGPTIWYLLLASRVEPRDALAATDGIAGDEYVVYRDGEDVCVDVAAEGDTPADTEQLGAALEGWVAKSPEGTASVEVDGDVVKFHSCDPGKDAKLASEVSPSLLALPVIRTQVAVEAKGIGATDEQARCLGDGVVGAFTIEQLTGDAVFDDAGQRKIAEIRSGCGL